MMIVPTPVSTARSSSATDLLLPWKPSLSASAPPASATSSSPPVQTSTFSPSSSTHRTIDVFSSAFPA